MSAEELLEQLLERLGQNTQSVPLSAQLWDTEMVASYLKRSYNTTRDSILVLPTFPAPIRLPSSGKGRAYPLYKAREVVEWAESYQSRKSA